MRKKPTRPLTIGLCGGIASGKSFVARALAELGAAVVDADTIGHQVLQRPTVVRTLTHLFGTSILADDVSIDRSVLSRLVFGDAQAQKDNLRALESIVHPLIHAAAVRQVREFKESATPPPMIVIDAPLLLEAKWAPMCDLILFIDAPESTRLERAKKRGWSEQQFRDRENAQMSLDEKKRSASHLIDGTLSESKLSQRLQEIVNEWES